MWAWLGLDQARPSRLVAKRRSGAGRSKALSYLFSLACLALIALARASICFASMLAPFGNAFEQSGPRSRPRRSDGHAGLADTADPGELPSLARPCPSCGTRMIVIERFERGATPRAPERLPWRQSCAWPGVAKPTLVATAAAAVRRLVNLVIFPSSSGCRVPRRRRRRSRR